MLDKTFVLRRLLFVSLSISFSTNGIPSHSYGYLYGDIFSDQNESRLVLNKFKSAWHKSSPRSNAISCCHLIMFLLPSSKRQLDVRCPMSSSKKVQHVWTFSQLHFTTLLFCLILSTTLHNSSQPLLFIFI